MGDGEGNIRHCRMGRADTLNDPPACVELERNGRRSAGHAGKAPVGIALRLSATCRARDRVGRTAGPACMRRISPWEM
jgi:hypothetical protein